MEQRGRGPGGTAGVIELRKRPPAPEYLTPDQKLTWRRTVDACPVDWFPTETHDVLVEYCQAVEASRKIALREQSMDFATADIDDLKVIRTMAIKESASISSLATKLRITNQARFDPASAGRKTRDGGAKKPWET